MTNFKPFTFITHPDYLTHATDAGDHPECARRILAITEKLQNGLLAPLMTLAEPRNALRDEILAFHHEDYLYRFEETTLSGRTFIDHPDNQICFDSYETAFRAAGAGLSGIDLLESDTTDIVFCNVRPPGHHAEQSSALGFCFFNNVVIAAKYWQKLYRKTKIVIIDWDAHHGNGIQSAFDEDPSVFYISIHEHPTFSFPGTGFADDKGTGRGHGTTLNIPLPLGADDNVVLDAMEKLVAPAIAAFNPEALIVAAGFDGHLLDDMSGLSYSTTLFGQLGIWMNVFANQYCGGKILSILEGGYHIEAVAAGVEAYIAGICAIPPEK